MEKRWTLDDLYSGFDSDEFKNDFSEAKVLIKDLSKWSAENLSDCSNPIDKIEEFIRFMFKIAKIRKLVSFCMLTQSVEAENMSAAKNLDSIRNLRVGLDVVNVSFARFLSKLENIDDLITSSELLNEHGFYIKEMADSSKYMLSEAEELIISKYENTGSHAWTNMVMQLTATHLVDIEIDGKQTKLPLPIVRNMAHDNSHEVRKKAYEAELKSYDKIEKPVAAALNGIKGEVITISKMRGYSSPLDMTLVKSRMDRETLDVMLSAMRDSFPAFRKYFHKKAELLGHKNGLPFYDITAPIGESDMRFSYEEAADYIVNNFNAFSENLGKFARHAFDNRWLDVEPRDGKRGGAFCHSLHYIKQCRILSNFTGSLNDVFTLAHELGHGYHGYCLRNETSLNTSYSMPIAETASNFCEELVSNAALKTASPNEAFTILEQKIADATQVIVDIYSRFLFEDEVLKRRENGPLSVNELKEIMIDAQKKAFGDGLDVNYMHPYMWVSKSHYYNAGNNYYNFPYAYGMLFTKGLFSIYLKEGSSFVDKYYKLLSESGKNSLADVAKKADIDVRDKAFWVSSLKLIENDIDKFIG